MKQELNTAVYYFRDKENRPRITVIIERNPKNNNIVNRGLAFCSINECPSKKVGRTIAQNRLNSIHTNKQSNRHCCVMNYHTNQKIRDVIDSCIFPNGEDDKHIFKCGLKAQLDTPITEYEKTLFE